MGLLFVLLVIIVATAAYLWYHQKQVVPAEAPPPSNRFHAVAIHAPVSACPEVRMLTSKKYLAKEAPRLPLDNCTAPYCQCRYDHYDDRRDEENRREVIDLAQYKGKQKRARKDRRKRISETARLGRTQ